MFLQSVFNTGLGYIQPTRQGCGYAGRLTPQSHLDEIAGGSASSACASLARIIPHDRDLRTRSIGTSPTSIRFGRDVMQPCDPAFFELLFPTDVLEWSGDVAYPWLRCFFRHILVARLFASRQLPVFFTAPVDSAAALTL